MALALLVVVDGLQVMDRIRHITCRRIITVPERLIKDHKRPFTSHRVLAMEDALRVPEVRVVDHVHLSTPVTLQKVANTPREMELVHRCLMVVQAIHKLLEM
ncbi:hypothetical protein ANCCEY_04823 [Ancylostoma ceylanicum]|uniref:Uncharacterized protein n=1 Tax=Ancylostoma ceylanicum TaxID=53326 RepID=A0A0D6LVK2_9BILA|nr:hypothetical protein ANCCEY_04823 [Ancylostoma ceylanicum]